ncbi:MAG: YggS family pyridoxal phosphate-dependent enzyme [Ornithinimicrobium sp.]
MSRPIERGDPTGDAAGGSQEGVASESRVRELRDALRRVEDRVERACAAAGRDRGSVTLMVVTKFFPARDVLALMNLGVADIGESRDQEARTKMDQVRSQVGAKGLPAVHMIGQVQTKKARSIVRYADAVHSVDRTRLVTALDRASGSAIAESERVGPLDVTLQVDLDDGDIERRGGVRLGEALSLADAIAAAEFLRLRGVMAIAPAGATHDEATLTKAFAALARCHAQIRSSHPAADWLSAGMSGDLEEAVKVGATHLRVGSAILGSRPTQR